MKVMIVDDNAEMRSLIRSLLRDATQEFFECADGAEAVDTFSRHRPEWTLMDVVMPGMDGLAATRAIKARFPEARILIITQSDNCKLRDSAREAGATDFLGKEDLDQLESIVTGTTEGA